VNKKNVNTTLSIGNALPLQEKSVSNLHIGGQQQWQHFEFCNNNLKLPLQEKVVSIYVLIPKPVTLQEVQKTEL